MKRKFNCATLLLIGAIPMGALAAESVPAPAANPPAKQAPAAPAAPAATEQTPPLFEQLDINHDGYVTREEAKRSAEVTARFQEIDSDRDGRIAATEYKKSSQSKL